MFFVRFRFIENKNEIFLILILDLALHSGELSDSTISNSSINASRNENEKSPIEYVQKSDDKIIENLNLLSRIDLNDKIARNKDDCTLRQSENEINPNLFSFKLLPNEREKNVLSSSKLVSNSNDRNDPNSPAQEIAPTNTIVNETNLPDLMMTRIQAFSISNFMPQSEIHLESKVISDPHELCQEKATTIGTQKLINTVAQREAIEQTICENDNDTSTFANSSFVQGCRVNLEPNRADGAGNVYMNLN